MYWLEFILCSAIVVITGIKLAKYGDVIAEKTGLGRAWIGLVLMASITSLPELISGISSVAIVDVPDIAVGDVFGSCAYNLAIIAAMDFANGKRPLFFGADRGHILSAGFGVILLALSVIAVSAGFSVPSLWHIGLYTPFIIGIYFFGVRAVYFYEKKLIKEFVRETEVRRLYEGIDFSRAVKMYILNAVILIIAATLLPFIADNIAKTTGLGGTFVGSVFVAMTTSLPELAVAIMAIRIGAQDMAIANLLGSNMFNILVLAIDDIFYVKGPLLSHVSTMHLTTALMAILMTGVVIVGLVYPPERKGFAYVSWYSLAIIVLWALNIAFLYAAAA